VLTISKPMKRWSIKYYNDTASQAKQASMDRQSAGGGLGEYYSEGDTRAPTWLVVGDVDAVGEATGLDGAALHGGFADTETVTRWLDDGVAPNGASGRAFGDTGVHGFDLVFAAPKSVSLLRALRGDDVTEKILLNAHNKGIQAAMAYLHEHAGYTRVHNPLTGQKDLQRLPGWVTVAYQHETSRCGDPHLHTHIILSNRQARADGQLVSIDSKSLHHEAKAAGIIYQAVSRHEIHAQAGFEWNPVDERSGMAEIAGVAKDSLKAWSQRSTRLREWAKKNLVIVDGEPTAPQIAAAQKATRPAKPETLAWADLKEQWAADARGLKLDRDAHFAARDARRKQARSALDRPRIARMASHIDKAAFTRADLVEVVGAQLPVDAPGDPRALIEQIVDEVTVRVSDPREPHHREGNEKYTVDAILFEEQRVLDMIDETDNRSRLDVRAEDLGDLSPDQESAIRNIATSPFLVQPLQAPAGAGKTHSLKALRAAAHRARKEVLVLAPTGKAVDEALQEEAGDRGLTVEKALRLIEHDDLKIDRRTVVVVDEASMVGTPHLKKLLSCAVEGRAKMVLVGDSYQLAPVGARGGMFEQMCADLPWSQRLGEVWRMRNREERNASLALRSGHGNRLRKAVGWYRTHDRLHTGDPIAMAGDALDAYHQDRAEGKDSLLICDTWEMSDALNSRLHDDLIGAQGPTARGQRDHVIGVGDIIMSRNNDSAIEVQPGAKNRGRKRVDQVRNGNRWRVAGIDADRNRIAAVRVTDQARAVFDGDYVHKHVTLGYASTVHSKQGVTADRSHAILGEGATRAMAYVAMTRGRESNDAYVYQRLTGESEHEHSRPIASPEIHQLRRGNKYSAAHYFRMILANDDRPHTMHAEAERAVRHLLPDAVAAVLDQNDVRRAGRRAVWREHTAAARARQAAYERVAAAASPSAERGVDRDAGLEL
jgi:conjugative relaxase-like TrwC/TraI family protein